MAEREQSKRTSQITFTVELDENHLPVGLYWQAPDGGVHQPKACKSFMIAIWEPDARDVLRVDLWRKDMLVDEMKQFFFQALLSMVETYERATNDRAGANEVRALASSILERLGLKRKSGQ